MRRLTLPVRTTATIAVVVALFTMSPALAQPLPPCTMAIDPIWNEGEELIRLLQNDPFGAAFDAYIRDLEDHQTKLSDWQERVERFFRDECRPVEQEFQHHEARRREHDQRCAGKPPDVWVSNQCEQSFDWLLASKARLDPKLAAREAKKQEFNQAGAALLTGEKRAVGQGKQVLNPNNTEEAFWLFAQKKSRDAQTGAITSCEAMAQLYGALGKKVGGNLNDMIMYTVKVLTEGLPRAADVARGSRPYATFSDTGFRPAYVDPHVPSSRNQVRHFVGYFAVGAKHPSGVGVISELLTEWGERRQPGDYELGVVAVNLARNMVATPNLVRGLDGAIRTTICR